MSPVSAGADTQRPQLKQSRSVKVEQGINQVVTLDSFLKDIEQRAYRMVHFSVGGHADAIDILQEAMLKLVMNYSEKPAEQWKPLFYRILNNKIRDWQRHQSIRNLVYFFRSDEGADPIDQAEADIPLGDPVQENMKDHLQDKMLEAIQGLPDKQRQCFLLRTWEGMSVAETATAMGCSEGSVKTHFFRAANKLKTVLGDNYDLAV